MLPGPRIVPWIDPVIKKIPYRIARQIMTKEIKIIFLSAYLIAGNAHADVYTCVDQYGRTYFQQTECEGNTSHVDRVSEDRLVGKQNSVSFGKNTKTIDGKNLLLNPDFEKVLDNWQVATEAKWFEHHGTNGSGVLQLHAKKPPQDKYIHETVVRQCVPVGDGSKFALGARFRHEGRPTKQHANRIRVTWYESFDCTTGGQFGTYAEPRDVAGWQHISTRDITPALSAKAALVEIVQKGRYTNNAKGYWDDVYLVATEISNKEFVKPDNSFPLGFDFIQNGDFSHDLSVWRIGWKSEWVGHIGHKKSGAVKVIASSSKGSRGQGAFNQCVNFGASTHFAMGASFKRNETSTQKGGGRLRVTWYEEADCRGKFKTDLRWVDPDDSKGWQTLRVNELQAEPGSTSARVQIIQTVLGAGEFSAYWDDVYFRTVSPSESARTKVQSTGTKNKAVETQ